MDFVLWKPSGPARPGLAVAGRHRDARAPGLAHRVLGHGVEASRRGLRDAAYLRRPAEREIFDIHGGGIDLVFPHHENEIAQSLLRLRHAAHGECLDA